MVGLAAPAAPSGSTSTVVAVKMLPEDRPVEQAERQEFWEEIKFLRELQVHTTAHAVGGSLLLSRWPLSSQADGHGVTSSPRHLSAVPCQAPLR